MSHLSHPFFAAATQTAQTGRGGARRWRRAAASVYTAAGFLAGAVLLVYPWLEWWEGNYFSEWVPYWTHVWLRGAVSGLGLVTIALVLSPPLRWRRRLPPPGSLHQPPSPGSLHQPPPPGSLQ